MCFNARCMCSVFVDVFSVSDLAGLPSSLIVADAVTLNFSVAVHNVDLQPVAASNNHKPVFNFEVSQFDEHLNKSILICFMLIVLSEDERMM